MAYFAPLPETELAVAAPPEVTAARQRYRRAYLNQELSLYIHYPFCVRKCPYCDFASLPSRPDSARDADYVSWLLREFELKKPLLQGRELVSVYLGGGTPSLCEPQELARLLAGLAPYLSADAEISLEANPGTVNQAKLTALRAAGFNRISIGVQSFDDAMLKRLGRIHSREEALAAAQMARAAGFSNFNLDLMHGLPQQDVAGALADLEQALALEPSHLSWYELTLEEGTYFGKHPPKLPDEDVLCDIEVAGFARLEAAGFSHYEVSAFGQGTTRCYHNQNYWLYGDYLSLGAGAHQKVSLKPSDAAALSGAALSSAAAAESGRDIAIWRACNSEDLTAYRDMLFTMPAVAPLQLGAQCHEVTDARELIFEYWLNRLRLRSDPVTTAEVKLRTGLDLQDFADDLRALQAQGLVHYEPSGAGEQGGVGEQGGAVVALTEQGNLMLNDVLAHFL